MADGEERRRAVCFNCGADISADDAQCPYCGALNPSGAEKAYMDALDDINDETGELAVDAQDDLEANVRSNVKRTVAVILLVAAVLVSLFLAATCMDNKDERRAVTDYQAREAFRSQYFDEFDRLYDAGDDDALSTYVWALSDDPGFDALFSWEHIGLLKLHDNWEALRSASRAIDEGDFTIDDYTWSVSLALRMTRIAADGGTFSTALSPEDEERASGYRAYALQYLENVLQMSEKELVAFADEVKDDEGFIQRDALKKSLEARLGQLGVLR